MRKSKAKQSIVETAQHLIEEKGYSDLNVNEVAYVAKVSVGTLYYHFPKGKVDILAEIMSQRLEGYIEKFGEDLSKEKLGEKNLSLDDTLRWIFSKVIALRRKDRPFLAAIQSEMLSNPDDYLELVKRYQTTDGLQQGMSILSDIMMKTAKPGTEELGKVKDRMDAIQRVVGLLMVYQVIFPGYFGSDDDFVDLALKVFYEMLRT